MNPIIRLSVIAMIASTSLQAKDISLLRAAEITTAFLKTEKIEGRMLCDVFRVAVLRHVQVDSQKSAHAMVWQVELKKAADQPGDSGLPVMINENGKKYRRVLEISEDGKIRLGRMRAYPRSRIVVPSRNPRVVPNRSEKAQSKSGSGG